VSVATGVSIFARESEFLNETLASTVKQGKERCIMPAFEIAAFYRFHRIIDPEAMRVRLHAVCQAAKARGILLVAPEGINGTLAVASGGMASLIDAIRKEVGIDTLEPRQSFDEEMPFLRLKVRVKKEIVTIAAPEADPTVRVGTYVTPKDWNALIADPDVVLVDTRNDYEYRIGTFKGAIDPQTKSFSEFPAYVEANLDPANHKKVAMFCTGGIRCEKASSYMLAHGFEEVFHLQGGILNYLETMPAEESLWEGGCFVFDRRVAVGTGLEPLDLDLCYGCRSPLTPDDHASPDYEQGVSCPHCAPLMTPAQKASSRERQRQTMLAEARGQTHIGPKHADAE
jgi:UPF0176 protein